MYASLAETLIAAHAELEQAGRLTLRSFAEHHADARKAQLERLTRLAQAEAGAATHVGPAAVARLRDALGGAVSDADVTAALSQAGVRIVEAVPRTARHAAPQASGPGQAPGAAGRAAVRRGGLRRRGRPRASVSSAGSGWPTAGRWTTRRSPRRGTGWPPAVRRSGQGAQRERPGHPARGRAQTRGTRRPAAVRDCRTAAPARPQWLRPAGHRRAGPRTRSGRRRGRPDRGGHGRHGRAREPCASKWRTSWPRAAAQRAAAGRRPARRRSAARAHRGRWTPRSPCSSAGPTQERLRAGRAGGRAAGQGHRAGR